MRVSRNDYMIIIKLVDADCTTQLKALTIQQIQKITSLSINKIRISMKYFVKLGYISEGIVDHNAKTYYITKEGASKLENLLKN